MSKKSLKIMFILFLIFGFCISYVQASDVNLNLPGTTTNQTDTNNNGNQNVANQVGNEENATTDDLNQEANFDSPLSPPETENLQSSGINTTSESGLGINGIINILLITVGVILILLAIAIIIRLK